MHRTQVLLEPEMYKRAMAEAQARHTSLGEVVREALGDYLARTATTRDPIEAILVDDPFDDPHPETRLSTDVDHYLYGAPRKSASSLAGGRRRKRPR